MLSRVSDKPDPLKIGIILIIFFWSDRNSAKFQTKLICLLRISFLPNTDLALAEKMCLWVHYSCVNIIMQFQGVRYEVFNAQYVKHLKIRDLYSVPTEFCTCAFFCMNMFESFRPWQFQRYV